MTNRKLHLVRPLAALPVEDEVDLVRLAAVGERKARETIALRLVKRVRNLAHHLVYDRTEAEDVAQAAMIEVLASLASFRGDSSLAHWADRITARVAYAQLRRHRRDSEALELEQLGRVTTTTTLQEGDSMLRSRLAAHFHRLQPDRRVVLVMKLIGGCSLSDISLATDAPLNTVKDRLRVGREELRRALLQDPAMKDFALEATP